MDSTRAPVDAHEPETPMAQPSPIAPSPSGRRAFVRDRIAPLLEVHGPLASEFDALATAARNGSPEAATTLFSNLTKCALQYDDHLEALRTLPAEAGAQAHAELRAVVTLCEGLTPRQKATTREWLNLAADNGDEAARIAYFTSGAPTYKELLKQPALGQAYRAKAYRYLTEAAQSGSVVAMRQLSLALWDGGVFERDPVLAFAYMQVANVASPAGPASARLLQRWHSQLTPEQVGAAARQAEAIRARCCG